MAEPGHATSNGRFAVVGSPIGHSLSPVLHRAAYRALGLDGPTYDAFEVPAGRLRQFLADGPGRDLRGLSVTMPGKPEAFALAAHHDAVSARLRISNTLVRADDGSWRAENHDVHGIVATFADHGLRGITRGGVLGSGATALSATDALAEMGAQEILFSARAPEKLAPLLAHAAERGAAGRVVDWSESRTVLSADAVVSAIAAPGSPPLRTAWESAGSLPVPAVFLDVLYDPWPSPLTELLAERGGAVASGLEMLVHQAARQVESMLGVDEGPVAPMMQAALEELARRADEA
ncbi:shikimate dehydrogenase [Brachybacterium phenoliresistens]|uniref:Shikimate dehydrogenase n=1 Tax=Brachybacterium phenoliresistens TaxID=396014 RepID=Z9JY14_9MICO|nr:shikimate dehydrogenase [Brachybacterium phenoliresistens]EWS82682.1 shikimate dehydrogenase [Brachybacterium phenoliresistens]